MKGGLAVGKAVMDGSARNLNAYLQRIGIQNVRIWQALNSRDCDIISHLRSCHSLRTGPKQESEINMKGKTEEGESANGGSTATHAS